MRGEHGILDAVSREAQPVLDLPPRLAVVVANKVRDVLDNEVGRLMNPKNCYHVID